MNRYNRGSKIRKLTIGNMFRLLLNQCRPYALWVMTASLCLGNFLASGQSRSVEDRIKRVSSCGVESSVSGQSREQQATDLQQWKLTIGSNKEGTYTIPVVFHLIEGTSTISDVGVSNALKGLNEAFAHAGSFGVDDTIGVDTRIRFCLAQRAPDGGITSGVTRMVSDYKSFDMDLETPKLKTMAQWDPRHYLNIWVVDDIKSEIVTAYTGRDWWTRIGSGGFATLPGGRTPQGAFLDGVVVAGLNTELLTHECGHYLGLLHTWSGGCANGDCLINGDMVCDTPPDDEIRSSCGANSCDTDTLSNYSNNNFFMDVPDMGSNFMDYGNAGCANNFSEGQAERMRFFLETARLDLYLENGNTDVCSPPCEQDIVISFTQDISKPLPTDTVKFVSQGSGTSNYEWYIDYLGDKSSNYSIAWGTGYIPTTSPVAITPNYEHIFREEGKYLVYLKAWNRDEPSCFTSYTKVVRVICGVDARYWPDKRVLASKRPDSLFTDSVRFTNRSTGATSYEWTVEHTNIVSGGPNLPIFESTDEHLVYLFAEPGFYYITLVASDGLCIDQAETFRLPVLDPTIDGYPVIKEILCHDEYADSIKLKLRLFNNGFDTVNIGTPISFYTEDPRQASPAPTRLFTYELPEIVYGFDSADYSITLPRGLKELGEIYTVFNDPGIADFPIEFPPADSNVFSFNTVFPPSGYAELDYANNIDSMDSGQDTLNLDLRDQWACLDEVVELEVEGDWNSITWSSFEQGALGSDNPTEYTLKGNDTLRVILQSLGDCRVEEAFQISVSVPQALATPDTSIIMMGGSITISASGGVSYLWSPSFWLTNPFNPSPVASPEETTTFAVEVTDSVGCVASDKVIVFVEEPAYVPNLFTPNNDGQNDFLKVYGLRDVQEFSFRVFNQAGSLVYENINSQVMSNQGWDGRWKGQEQPIGMYYWRVTGKHAYKKEILLNEEQSGVVHLVR